MIRMWIYGHLRRYGTPVQLSFRRADGELRTIRTRAIVNLYRRGLERSFVGSFTNMRSDLGAVTGEKVILFLPWNVLDDYDGKADVFVRLRGRKFVMQACTDIPLGEETVYTWMVCAPYADAVAEGFGNIDGEDDTEAGA